MIPGDFIFELRCIDLNCFVDRFWLHHLLLGCSLLQIGSSYGVFDRGKKTKAYVFWRNDFTLQKVAFKQPNLHQSLKHNQVCS